MEVRQSLKKPTSRAFIRGLPWMRDFVHVLFDWIKVWKIVWIDIKVGQSQWSNSKDHHMAMIKSHFSCKQENHLLYRFLWKERCSYKGVTIGRFFVPYMCYSIKWMSCWLMQQLTSPIQASMATIHKHQPLGGLKLVQFVFTQSIRE